MCNKRILRVILFGILTIVVLDNFVLGNNQTLRAEGITSDAADNEESSSPENVDLSKYSTTYDLEKLSKQRDKLQEALEFKPVFQPIESVPVEELFTPEEREAKRRQEELIANAKRNIKNENATKVAELRSQFWERVGVFLFLGAIVVFRILSDWSSRQSAKP